ncbi:MAG TPA: tRNA (cytidine(34)-2'-O)-methyltransferase [Alphaproteobacteria bacterium]|nr:tRNA (cytidine(34)-2'-O)-methyltransferase [Alphaproteobacteria bacterium]
MKFIMDSLLRLALFEPDMPPNTGAMMRLCACFGLPLDIIEPCGFAFDDKKLRRVAMDYIDLLDYKRHRSWDDFRQHAKTEKRRIVLLTTKTKMPYYQFDFQKNDILMVGRESSGVPEVVHSAADARVTVPMVPEARSLNVGMAAAIVMAEALRQTTLRKEGGFA